MSALIWLAIDGLGHPDDAPPGNPWEQELPTLGPVIAAGQALDATLGVPGLPQSGTGQACWLTGQDAVREMGEHYGPQPGPTLQKMLSAQSLPVRLAQAGRYTQLLNFYAPEYFAALDKDGRGGRNRMGCFPYSFRAAGRTLNPPEWPLVRASLGLGYTAPHTPFMTLDDVRQCGVEVAKAAHNAAHAELLVVDLWFGDLLGHQGRPDAPPEVLQTGRDYLLRLDALLEGLLQAGARVVLSSDHGNLENLHVKSHTLARVPFAGVGVNLPPVSTVIEGGQAIAGLLGLGLLRQE